MGSVLAYKYWSDAGTLYQVLADSDFAPFLNYQLAVGTEPYLPQAISVRYVTYVCPTPPIWRTAMVPDLTTFGSPAQNVPIGGLVYLLRSSIGEQVFAQQAGNVILASGPPGAPGPPGPPGTVGAYNFTLATTQSYTGGALTLGSVTVPSGSYVIVGQAYFEASPSDLLTDMEAWVQDSSSNLWAGGSFTFPATTGQQAVEINGLCFVGYVTLAAPDTLTMQVSASTISGLNNCAIGGVDTLSFPGTTFTALKVA